MKPEISQALSKFEFKKLSCKFFHGVGLTDSNIYTWST